MHALPLIAQQSSGDLLVVSSMHVIFAIRHFAVDLDGFSEMSWFESAYIGRFVYRFPDPSLDGASSEA